MKNIKVLGSGCANCQTTAKLIEETARELGVEIALEKVEDIGQIMSYGVMSTPGVVSTAPWSMPEACPTASASRTG